MARKTNNADGKIDTVETNTTINKPIVTVVELNDSDEVEVVACVPNLSFKDFKTGDVYEWRNVDDVEYMSVESLKNMYRNNRDYFRNLYLKINNEWLIKKFNLTKIYDEYEYLTEMNNYTQKNIKVICKKVSDSSTGIRHTIINRVKTWVANGDINDIKVIRDIERSLNIDLIQYI